MLTNASEAGGGLSEGLPTKKYRVLFLCHIPQHNPVFYDLTANGIYPNSGNCYSVGVRSAVI